MGFNKELWMKVQVRVTKKVKKTKAAMFSNIEVGDILELSISVDHVGGNRGRTYAPTIYVINAMTSESTTETFNTITKRLNCFELEEVNEDNV